MTKIFKSVYEVSNYLQTKLNILFLQLSLSSDTVKSVYYDECKRRLSTALTIDCNVPLLKEDEVPSHLREIAILTGYRCPTSSVKDCAVSVFCPTNETLNFWTHFLPTFYFVWQMMAYWEELDIYGDSYMWPFGSYLITICIYPLMSALAHTFFSTSDMARHFWFFLDYGSLSLYAYGAGLLVKAYDFPQELHSSLFERIFMEVLVFLVILCTVLACYSRFLESLVMIKIFRLGAFAIPWVWDSFPVVYRLVLSDDLSPLSREHFYLHFMFSFLIGFFYASHLPERLAPGKFDFVGNSHQLLHICGIMATHQQMSAGLIDMRTRRTMLKDRHFPDYWSVEIFGLVFFSITLAIAIFMFCAFRYEENLKKEAKREE